MHQLRMGDYGMNDKDDKQKKPGDIKAEEKLQKLFKELGFPEEKPDKDIEHD